MGKKHRKHKKDKRSKKKSKYSDSSISESETSSEEEWVEKVVSKEQNINSLERDDPMDQNEQKVKILERDEWMSITSLFPSVSRQKIRQEKDAKKEKKEEDKFMLDKLGQTERELNPYWKDGGTGLPEEEKAQTVESLSLAKTTVGDQGAHWLRKALQRAKEQAVEESRRLEDVVAERWGSLEKLETMLADAEKREKEVKEKLKGGFDKYQKKEYRKYEDNYDRQKRVQEFKDKGYNRDYDTKDRVYENVDHKKDEVHGRESYRRDRDMDRKDKLYEKNDNRKEEVYERGYNNKMDRNYDKDNERKNRDLDRNRDYRSNQYKHDRRFSKGRTSRGFIKPGDGDDEITESRSSTNSMVSSSSKGWRKKEFKESVEKNVADRATFEFDRDKSDEVPTISKKIDCNEDTEQILSDKEMNELAAKVMKAELLGNTVLASELQTKLENARTLRLKHPQGVPKDTEETVILTRTDSKGFTRPLTIEGSHAEPSGGRRKGQKMETHKDGKRMRYFADDDKYSLQDMFQREKLSTVEDQNEMFAKLASKGVGKDDSARDMDDVFEETARVKESEGRTQAKERDKAIKEHKRTERALDNCEWCLDSKLMFRHLIIAIGNKCYLCLPPYQSLTEGHCLIIPTFHTPCATQLDEDVWDEIQTFRKSLTNMFKAQDEDVVFFESSMHLKRMPHMVLHCVPMPKETGDLAPIYFKKAILECEMEWSTNKKIVDLSGKDVRRAVPKGLPYFAVDFGLQSGYAHVIEDEKLFPQNFAQEIIGGMLDLDHALWRKPKKEKLDQQTKKVLEFTKLWKSFDCTKTK